MLFVLFGVTLLVAGARCESTHFSRNARALFNMADTNNDAHLSESKRRLVIYPLDIGGVYRTTRSYMALIKQSLLDSNDKKDQRATATIHEDWRPVRAMFEGELAYENKSGQRAMETIHEWLNPIRAKFENELTQIDYRKYTQRVRPIVNRQAWNPPTDRFEGRTTFKVDYRYIQSETPERISFKPNDTAKITDAQFRHSTVRRDTYVPHSLRPQETYKPDSVPFDGLTTFQRDYKRTVDGQSQNFKPLGRPFQSMNAQFEGQTTFVDDYRKLPMERTYVHPHDVYLKPQGEMEKMTTHQSSYTEMTLARVQVIRPSSAKKETVPFDSTINQHMDSRRLTGERADYVPTTARFEEEHISFRDSEPKV